jgi:hypothetical protein
MCKLPPGVSRQDQLPLAKGGPLRRGQMCPCHLRGTDVQLREGDLMNPTAPAVSQDPCTPGDGDQV